MQNFQPWRDGAEVNVPFILSISRQCVGGEGRRRETEREQART